MEAKFSSRLLAFLIDVIIVTLIFSLINSLLPKSHNIQVLEQELTELRSNYLKKDIDISVYFNRYATIQRSLDQQHIPNYILNTVIILCYFGLVPYYWDGKTVGKKLLKIKVIKNEKKTKVSLNDYLLRLLINNGIICLLISMVTVFIFDDVKYLLTVIICGIIQFLLVIISSFMIIYRHDLKGVHDLICGTSVIKER